MSRQEFTQLSPSFPPDQYGSGMMLVAPLSEENADRVRSITSKIEDRLGATLWTPHTDITVGRILESGIGKTPDFWQEKFNTALSAAIWAVEDMAAEIAPFTTTFDTVSASAQAIIAQASQGTEPVAAIRQQFLERLGRAEACEPSIKQPDFVHTTMGRYLTEDLLVKDVERVTTEVVASMSDIFPFSQTTTHLLIAEEPKIYELVPREAIMLVGTAR